jgi:hypothetical protein
MGKYHVNKNLPVLTEAERFGKYRPYQNTSKTYKPNGAREIARRLKRLEAK